MTADEVELDSQLFCPPQNSTRSLVRIKWIRSYPIHMVLVGGGVKGPERDVDDSSGVPSLRICEATLPPHRSSCCGA